jgi:glyoxylase-like metal-dependent hydrolase (beta-lactamase superfamily II)
VPSPHEIETRCVIASRFALDGGAMFGVIPRPLWERRFPADERGRIRLVARVMVARYPRLDRTVVIDSGMGTAWGAREVDRFGLDTSVPDLGRALAEIGIDPAEVTDAVMTHLHFDHAGGWVRPDGAGDLEPVLPRAAHHVQRSHLTWARAPSSRDRGSFAPHLLAPIESAGLLHPVEGEGELFPGLELLCSGGHTTALQIPLLSGPSGTGVFPADLIPTAAHLRDNWGMAYDLRPLETLEEKTRLLARARRGAWTVILEHDPEVEAVVVEEADGESIVSPCACPRAL